MTPEAIKDGSLVIANQYHPANVVFRVRHRTANGWLTCHTYSTQEGVLLPGDTMFRFRVTDMRVWEGK